METIDMFYQNINEFINIISSPIVKYLFISFFAFSLVRFCFKIMSGFMRYSTSTTKKEDKEEITAYKIDTIEESQYIEQTEIYDPLDPNFYVDPYDDFRG